MAATRDVSGFYPCCSHDFSLRVSRTIIKSAHGSTQIIANRLPVTRHPRTLVPRWSKSVAIHQRQYSKARQEPTP